MNNTEEEENPNKKKTQAKNPDGGLLFNTII